VRGSLLAGGFPWTAGNQTGGSIFRLLPPFPPPPSSGAPYSDATGTPVPYPPELSFFLENNSDLHATRTPVPIPCQRAAYFTAR
jgi:hypothetical protein